MGVHVFLAHRREVDPRFLVFEFMSTMLLRKEQFNIINKCVDSINKDQPYVRQMIMGAGKTTVVSPLISLMTAHGQSLVVQCVPNALLRMSIDDCTSAAGWFWPAMAA